MHLSPEDQSKEDNDLEVHNLHSVSVAPDLIRTQTPSDAQESWEDVSDAEDVSHREIARSSTSSSQTASSVSLRKKRRAQTKTTSMASPAIRAAKACKKTPNVRKEGLQEVFTEGVRFTASYTFGVFKGSIEKMRKPLSWLLFLYMLTWVVSRMMPTIQMVFSPLCIIPGASKSMLCLTIRPVPFVNFEKLANIQSTTFEKLIGESGGGSQLSIDILRAEMATQDLSPLVRYSDLKSKDDIVDMLHTICIGAKRTGRGLTKLNAKVVDAIDEVIALNNYAMVTIEDAHKKAPSRLLQAVSPIKLGPTAREIITQAFTLAMDESERAIEKLILEAEVSRQSLVQLSVDIKTLHEMITREDKHTTRERGQSSKLRGKKKAVRDYDDRLALLNNLGGHRRQAAAHIKAALLALHTMSDDLEVLRERVVGHGLLEGKLPLHVHMENIRSGLERLQRGRMVSRGRIDEEAVRMWLTDYSK